MKRQHDMNHCMPCRSWSAICDAARGTDDPHWRRQVTKSDESHVQLDFLFLMVRTKAVTNIPPSWLWSRWIAHRAEFPTLSRPRTQ